MDCDLIAFLTTMINDYYFYGCLGWVENDELKKNKRTLEIDFNRKSHLVHEKKNHPTLKTLACISLGILNCIVFNRLDSALVINILFCVYLPRRSIISLDNLSH